MFGMFGLKSGKENISIYPVQAIAILLWWYDSHLLAYFFLFIHGSSIGQVYNP